jgi:hypothetical protein
MTLDLSTRNPNAWPPHLADLARSILRQYNECADSSNYHFQGPHYVVYSRGEFVLHPFGVWMEDYYRYSFECRPEIVPWQEEPLWTFVVMC